MSISRRSFLLRTLPAGAVVAAGPALGGCGRHIDPAGVADFSLTVDGKLSIPVALFPDLVRDGGALTVRATGLANPILLLHPSGTNYVATAATCSHAGCPLGFVNGQIECPCHGSAFGLDGKVLNPPARQGLKTYTATYNSTSGDVIIDLTAGDANFPSLVDGKVSFKLTDYPQLTSVGGFVVGSPQGWGMPLLVIALVGPTFAAVDATCTHLGCAVSYTAGAGTIQCPCHGSAFATDGTVLQGPATKPLKKYSASSDGSTVIVQLV